MPLSRGKSKKTRNSNIKKLLDEYKVSGKIGRIAPRSMAHAQEIAAAIGYRQQEESANPKKKKR